MKKPIFIIAVFACFCLSFGGTNGWQPGEFDVNQLTIESWGTDACTGNFVQSLKSAPLYWSDDYFYINITTNIGKQLLANLMLAKATGRKVGIQITNTYNGRPVITGVSVH